MAAPAASLAAAATAVPMLRCMTECRDVQFVLMQLLRLTDLAAIHGTCRSWRRWLLNTPLIGGLQFEFVGSAEPLILLAQSDWARRLVTTLHLQTWHRDGSRFLLDTVVPAETELAVCDQLLSALPQFARLHTLELGMCDAFAATSLWSTCFAAVSGSLLHLRLNGNRQAASVNSILAHVGRLRRLTALTIFVADGEVARELDLSQLPSFPWLHTVKLFAEDEQGKEVWFRLTPQQVQWLAQCSRLTHLDCGVSWSPNLFEFDDEGQQLPTAAQQIDEGIATLVRGLTLQSAVAAATTGASEPASSSTSVAPPTSTAAPCRLEFLNLLDTIMSAAVWEHVSQLTGLTKLMALCWRSDVTPQLWARLVDFKRLQFIRVTVLPFETEHSPAPLRTEHFLPSLLQCAQLQSVALAGPTLSLSADQLDGIARLPLLESFGVDGIEIESVAPLVHATKLQLLHLCSCRGPPAVVDFRRSLPPLPLLTWLRIEDRDRITADQAAPLNAALFARMPKLTLAQFKQNLLA